MAAAELRSAPSTSVPVATWISEEDRDFLGARDSLMQVARWIAAPNVALPHVRGSTNQLERDIGSKES